MAIYLNDTLVEFTKYPNGETVVPKIPYEADWTNEVRLHWDGDADIVKLALVKGLLDQLTEKHKRLIIDYMPYSRMDREQDGHCFSLKWVAHLIDRMHWSDIRVVEPHSAATLTELAPSSVEPVWATARLTPLAMKEMDFVLDRDWLVFPDRGAADRYLGELNDLGRDCNLVVMEKRRDFDTGKIVGLDVDYRVERRFKRPGPGAKALIVDDLCSRGGTFIQASEILRHSSLKCSEVNLLVTHMEWVGVENPSLSSMLTRVFCTDTMFSDDYLAECGLPSNFRVFDRKDWL